LFQEVASLLAEDESSFLDRPPDALALAGLPPGTTAAASARRVGNYFLLERLGSGTLGEVYHAIDAKRQREVAVRLLPQTFVADPQHLWQLQRDARVLAWLNDSHVGAIFGLKMFGVQQHALILELVKGQTLAARVAAAPLEPSAVLAHGRQIAKTLAAVHAQRVAHGRLRLANVVVRDDGACKILDFGIGPAQRSAADDVRDCAQMLLDMLGGRQVGGPGFARLLHACLDPSPGQRPRASDLLLQLEEQRAW
jgi:serine/threonine protein kinase